VFGSTATGSGTQDSDVDVAVRMVPGPRGFRRLEQLDTIQARLSQLLSRPVDVVEEPARSPRVQDAIERHRVPAF
jgi:predicted nucleotidyltransferase